MEKKEMMLKKPAEPKKLIEQPQVGEEETDTKQDQQVCGVREEFVVQRRP